jgi:hypothetical protein
MVPVEGGEEEEEVSSRVVSERVEAVSLLNRRW